MEANNMAKMREALEIAKTAICHHAKYICDSLSWENSMINANCGDILCAHRDLCEAKTAIQKALSAPPRNCDIGSVEEQKERFEEFCADEKGNREHCRNCRLCNAQDCELTWAQMPYEGEDSDGNIQ